MRVRKWFAITLSLLLVLSLVACSGASMETSDSYYSNGDVTEDYLFQSSSVDRAPESPMSPAETEKDQTQLPEGRKWIVTVDMRAETEDMDAMLDQIHARVAELGGYLEDSNVYNGSNYGGRRYRYANLTIRVPADQADNFTSHVGSISNVVSNNKRLDDVTLTYVATESRMKALQVEEARLLELMEKAETMSDLLEIEARLTDVRYELERATSQLRVYDNLVDYATINLNIEEVQEYTPVEEEKTLWQRIGDGFMDSLKGLGSFLLEVLVFLITKLPYLLLFGGIVFLIVFLCRRSAKKRRAGRPVYPVQPPYPVPHPYPMQPPAPQPNPPEMQD